MQPWQDLGDARRANLITRVQRIFSQEDTIVKLKDELNLSKAYPSGKGGIRGVLSFKKFEGMDIDCGGAKIYLKVTPPSSDPWQSGEVECAALASCEWTEEAKFQLSIPGGDVFDEFKAPVELIAKNDDGDDEVLASVDLTLAFSGEGEVQGGKQFLMKDNMPIGGVKATYHWVLISFFTCYFFLIFLVLYRSERYFCMA